MQLQFNHNGRQFFFITLAIEGRLKALSQLIDAQTRPLLTWAGEIVKAALVAMHQVFTAVTVSDFVIMPDHVHFLLIVNYGISPKFNPLWATHMLMNAVEAAWDGTPERTGAAAPDPPQMAPLLAAVAERGRIEAAWLNQLMRNHSLTREEALAQLSQTRNTPSFSGACNVATLAGDRGWQPPSVQNRPLRFNRHCYIELSFDSRQLKAIRRYIRLNPARALWKLAHPDRFMRFPNICHAVLDPTRTWQGMGNLTLLGSPFLFHVRLTLKKSVAEHEAAIAEIVEKAQRGWVPISGFISPGEVEALRRLKATPSTRFIKMLPCSLPPRYDPSAEDSRELAADRLLILSGFADTPAISGLDIRRAIGTSRQFRANCLAMNDLAATLCQLATFAIHPKR